MLEGMVGAVDEFGLCWVILVSFFFLVWGRTGFWKRTRMKRKIWTKV